jgi:dTDP-4-amino-4,6-dideoxygalactose transaminase
MSVSDALRHTSTQVLTDSYSALGYNYRLTDIQAAVGREQILRLPLMVSHRRELVERYRQLLANASGIVLPLEPAWARSNWQSFAIRLDARHDRQAVMQRMLDEGVATRRGVMSAHLEEAYPAGTWRTTPAGLRTSEDVSATALVLPLYHQMTVHDQDRVVTALGRACGW